MFSLFLTMLINAYLVLFLVLGFFSGCLVALIAATILRIVSQQLMKKKVGTFYMENIFRDLSMHVLYTYELRHLIS